MKKWLLALGVALGSAVAMTGTAGDKATDKDNTAPPGYTALFNGKDLTNWQGLWMAPDPESPKPRNLPAWLVKMDCSERESKQKAANDKVFPHWTVKDGILHYDGKGNSLQTVKEYGNFELLLDWRIEAHADSGLYLRGNPQVQIWGPKAKNNDNIGSGGLYNNQKNPNKPLVNADNPPNEWNTFWIKMVGDKVTIKLNDKLVVDNTPLENYWDRGKPLPARGPIELQHHGDHLQFKNIYVKELAD